MVNIGQVPKLVHALISTFAKGGKYLPYRVMKTEELSEMIININSALLQFVEGH